MNMIHKTLLILCLILTLGLVIIGSSIFSYGGLSPEKYVILKKIKAQSA